MKASRFTLPLVSALVALAALPAVAALRAWEPSDYVQEDLVLHYDGIRNAGVGAAHDPAATTWKDLSPSAKDATFNTAEDGSAWTADGYSFGGGSYATASGTVSLGTVATVQAVTKTTIETLRESEGVNGNQWSMFIGGKSSVNDACNIYYNKGNKKFVFKNANGGNADLLQANWDGRYLTAIRNGNDKYLFSGAALPSAPAASGSQSAMGDVQFWLGSADGGSGSFAARYFKGPLNAIRLYSRVLENKELAWNRAVDEARFFGVAIPESALLASAVPDAVVATAVEGAEGAEASGCHMVDGDGHTFRAAPFATVGGASYVCTGYTLASWDDTLAAYGAAVAHDGEFACFVAPGDKVRIEWQWTAASGAMAANPYVTDGLVLYYDGEWNAGFGAHDGSATVWKDLSASGNDATFVKLADGGEWLDNAYSFATNGHFQTQSSVALGASFTVQTVTDHGDYVHLANTWPWLFGSADGKFQIYPSSGAPNLVLNADGLIGGSHRSQFTWTDRHCLTAMFNVSSNALFQGTTPGNWGSAGNASTGPASQTFCIGGCDATFAENNKGNGTAAAYRTARAARTPYHAVRVYNRLLTPEELARNRAVDEARFFGKGASATGCVVVQSAVAGLEGRETSGVYFPDGWTFSAGAGTNTVRGIGWRCAGYQLQTWDADSATWGAQRTVLFGALQAAEWTSPSGASFASVRLTWLWEPVSGARTAADYAPADYAAGGLQLHLDGLARGSSATVWSDLSGNGRDATLAGNASGESHWTDDGYFFASNAVFATADNASGVFSLGHDYTMETAGDIGFADNLRDTNLNGGTVVTPFAGISWGSIWFKSDTAGTVQHHTSGSTGAEWNMRGSVYLGVDGRASYLTALRTGSRAALVEGTVYPATENTIAHQACMDWSVGSTDRAAAASRWLVGASTLGGGGNPLWGVVKSVRLYDRMLSEDELAWNRRVDEARFFGRLATTNVVLEASEWNGALAAGPYEVFGAHTFVASPSTVDNHLPTHVRVWTRRPDGTWASAGSVEGASYAYAPGAGTVKIQFRATHPLVLVVR